MIWILVYVVLCWVITALLYFRGVELWHGSPWRDILLSPLLLPIVIYALCTWDPHARK